MSFMTGDVIAIRRNNQDRRPSPPRRPVNPAQEDAKNAVEIMDKNFDFIAKIFAKPIIDLTCLPSIFDKNKALDYVTFKIVFNHFYNDHYSNLNNYGYQFYAAKLKAIFDQLATIDATLAIKDNHEVILEQAMFKDDYACMYANEFPAEVWMRIMFHCDLNALAGLAYTNTEFNSWLNQIGSNHDNYLLIKDGYYLQPAYGVGFSDIMKAQGFAKSKKHPFEFFIGRNRQQERLDFIKQVEPFIVTKASPALVGRLG